MPTGNPPECKPQEEIAAKIKKKDWKSEGKAKEKQRKTPDQNQNQCRKRTNCRKITLETNKTRLLR